MFILSTLLFACGDKVLVDTAATSETEETQTEESETEETETEETETEETDTDDTSSDSVEDYSKTGPYTQSSASQSVSLNACESPMAITTVATSNTGAPTVIIAHGFFRSSANMIEWAQHLGTWGLNSMVVDMCHFSDHSQNGIALAELASTMGISNPLYMGFSAGGLASLVAASNSNPLGVVTLDPVDDMAGTGSTITDIPVNVLGLIGEPSECNSQNNSIGLLQNVSADYIFRIQDADHCDFEAPTDDLCENGVLGFGACGNTTATLSDETIRSTIRGLGTSGVLWLSGLDSDAADWWTGSQNQVLRSDGLISPL